MGKYLHSTRVEGAGERRLYFIRVRLEKQWIALEKVGFSRWGPVEIPQNGNRNAVVFVKKLWKSWGFL